MSSRWPASSGGGGGGGITGLTPGKVPLAATSSTLADSPITHLAGTAGHPSTDQTVFDGGSTNGNGAIVAQPSSGYGCYGAGVTLDNQKIDGNSGGSLLWNIIALASTFSSGGFQKWFGLLDGLTPTWLMSPTHNFYIGDNRGEYANPPKLKVGGDIETSLGGKFRYTPTTGSDWAGDQPTGVQEALDRLAAVAASKP